MIYCVKTRSGEIPSGGGAMTFQEKIKALPQAERDNFYRAIMLVVNAGVQAGVPPKEWANLYADVYSGVNDLIEESKK